MHEFLRLAAVILVSAGALALARSESAAQTPYPHGRVTAHSDYGHGSVTGAVRRRGNIYEVQLPSGRWEDCEGDCRETLRRQHLDFWRAIDEDVVDAPGT
jgi:hypothetical protein